MRRSSMSREDSDAWRMLAVRRRPKRTRAVVAPTAVPVWAVLLMVSSGRLAMTVSRSAFCSPSDDGGAAAAAAAPPPPPTCRPERDSPGMDRLAYAMRAPSMTSGPTPRSFMEAMTRVNVAKDRPARSSNQVAPAPAVFLRRWRSPALASSASGQPKSAVGVDAAALAATASTQRETRPRSSARGRRPSHDLRARMVSLGFLNTVWDMNRSAREMRLSSEWSPDMPRRSAAQRSGAAVAGVRSSLTP
uniref:Uncharacterized protein n=2 Tax=Arundo donax TaxID=35708 RepID=A0A0A9DFL9_ARUDO